MSYSRNSFLSAAGEDQIMNGEIIGKTYVGVSEYYAEYENDFNNLIKEVIENIQIIEKGYTDMKNLYLTEQKIKDADTCLRQMEIEIQSSPNASSFAHTMSKSRRILSDLSRQFENILQNYQREKLLNTKHEDNYNNANPHNYLLGIKGENSDDSSNTGTAHTLYDSARKLESARRIAVETEDVGLNIMGTLRSQRDTIMRARHYGYTAEQGARESSSMIVRMLRRARMNKLMLYFIICLLIAAIMIFIVSLLHRNHSN